MMAVLALAAFFPLAPSGSGFGFAAAAEEYEIWTTLVQYESILWKAPRKKDLPKGMVFDKESPPNLTFVDADGIPVSVKMRKAGGRKWRWKNNANWWENSDITLRALADGSSFCQAFIIWQDKRGKAIHQDGWGIRVEDWRPLEKFGSLLPRAERGQRGEETSVIYPCGGEEAEVISPDSLYVRRVWTDLAVSEGFVDEVPELAVLPYADPRGVFVSLEGYKRDDLIRWYLPQGGLSRVPCDDKRDAEVYIFDEAAASSRGSEPLDYHRIQDLWLKGQKVVNIRTDLVLKRQYTYVRFMCDGSVVLK